VLTRLAKNAFNAGELSRRMDGRSDLDGIYDRAVAKMLNYVPALEGPAMKRPGTRYKREAAASAEWVSRFVFNNTQAYVLEWSDYRVRFFTNGGRIEDASGNPFELAVPYTAAEARRLSIKQSFDRLYIAHPSHAPAMITRVDAERFEFAPIPLINGPYSDWNTDKTSTVEWSGDGHVDAVATISATAPIFNAGHVGGQIIFEVHDFSDVAAWEASCKATAMGIGAKRRSDGKVYSAQGFKGPGSPVQPYTGTIQPIHTEGDEWDGSGDIVAGTDNDVAGVLWRYEYDRYGAGEITAVTDAHTATIRVTRRLPDTDATHRWALGLFSTAAGWPQLVDVWAQRLIFWKGVEIAGSVVGDYFNFAPLDDSGIFAPDMSFRRKLSAADAPIWSHADKEYLLAGSVSGELVVGQINSAAGVSADNLRGDPQSSYGSSLCWPIQIGTGLLFVQRGGRKIREAQYSYTEERFVGENVNIYARHITRSGINWLAFQQEPEELVWGGRGDGLMICHPHSPEQQVKGFARVQLAAGATVLAGVTIPSDDGQLDELWILAELDGQKSILQLADWWDEDLGLTRADAFFVDFGVQYDGTRIDPDTDLPLGPKAEFTKGVSHLNGRTVRVLADGVEYNDLAVIDGTLTLPKPATKVTVGLGYAARLRLLRPAVRGTGQTTEGFRIRAARLFARLVDSGPLSIFNRAGKGTRLFDRSNNLPMNTVQPLFTGGTRNVAIDNSGSEVDPDTGEIVSDDALPSIITMLVGSYELEELKG
jgi:hypothetical protein